MVVPVLVDGAASGPSSEQDTSTSAAPAVRTARTAPERNSVHFMTIGVTKSRKPSERLELAARRPIERGNVVGRRGGRRCRWVVAVVAAPAPARPGSCSTARRAARRPPCPPCGAACCPGPRATGPRGRRSRWPRRPPSPDGPSGRSWPRCPATGSPSWWTWPARRRPVGVAQLFLGLRQAGSDPLGASRSLIAVLDADRPPWEHSLVRRLLPGLTSAR